jgi:hypothetical protein
VAGGFSETYVTLQIIILLTFLVAVYLFVRGESRRSGLLFLGSGLFGGIAALILVIDCTGKCCSIEFYVRTIGRP